MVCFYRDLYGIFIHKSNWIRDEFTSRASLLFCPATGHLETTLALEIPYHFSGHVEHRSSKIPNDSKLQCAGCDVATVSRVERSWLQLQCIAWGLPVTLPLQEFLLLPTATCRAYCSGGLFVLVRGTPGTSSPQAFWWWCWRSGTWGEHSTFCEWPREEQGKVLLLLHHKLYVTVSGFFFGGVGFCVPLKMLYNIVGSLNGEVMRGAGP